LFYGKTRRFVAIRVGYRWVDIVETKGFLEGIVAERERVNSIAIFAALGWEFFGLANIIATIATD